MFPPGLPRYFIEQCSRVGDVVLDPFCGRGTTPLEACLAGRIGIGMDLNPLAVLLTGAKVHPPRTSCTYERIRDLRERYQEPKDLANVPPEIRMLFHREVTLPQLVYLREQLDRKRIVDRYLLATLAGILHGNHRAKPEESETLSVSMPNTFSMSPQYIRKFINEKGLRTYPVDVFASLERRVTFLNRQGRPGTRGRVVCQDARVGRGYGKAGSVDLIVTSPPYLRVVSYGRYNWIRLWLLGESVVEVDRRLGVAATDRKLGLTDRCSLPKYRDFIGVCGSRWNAALKPGGICVVVVGDVRRNGRSPIKLAQEAWTEIRARTDFRLVDVLEDELPSSRKVTKIWGDRRGKATKTDRVLILRRPGGRKCRARAPERIIGDLVQRG